MRRRRRSPSGRVLLEERQRACSCVSQRLLSRGALLDVKCPAVRSYKSALCVACEINNSEIIKLLLEAGGDPNARGQNAYTPTLVSQPERSLLLFPAKTPLQGQRLSREALVGCLSVRWPTN